MSSHATLNKTFTAEYNGILPKTPLVRPQLYGLRYPRQPSPQGNFIKPLYVKT